MELPTKLGVEVDDIAGLLEWVILLVNIRKSVLKVKIRFPREVILVVEKAQFAKSDAIDVVVTTRSPIDKTSCTCI